MINTLSYKFDSIHIEIDAIKLLSISIILFVASFHIH